MQKAVVEYAERLTATPADVPDELFATLRAELDEAQLVELTTVIAWENYRARFNRGFDVEPQGFSAGAYCPVPQHLSPS